jgi:ADP-heptose:LPS heptosyltransferase
VSQSPQLVKRERILVLIRGHVADVVSAFPALRDLRRAYPEAHIAVIVNEYVRDAFDHCPYVNEVIEGFLFKKRSGAARIRHNAALISRVASKFDVVLGMHNSPRSVPLIGVLAGARERLAYAEPGPMRLLLSQQLGSEPDHNALRARNSRVVAALGVEGSPAYSPIDWLPTAGLERVSQILKGAGVTKGTRFAVLHMSSNWGCNEWASRKWAELADFLSAEAGLITVVTGTSETSELHKFEEVQALTKSNMISLHGKTSLPQLFEVVRRASLVVAVDSALTQVALAQRTPAVVMWGIEPIAPNGPLPDERLVQFEPVQHWEGSEEAPPPNPFCPMQGVGPSVSSCHTSRCCENSSIARISVEEIKERVLRVLAISEQVREGTAEE